MALTPEQQDVLARAKTEDVKFVNLQFIDVVGIIKSVTLPVERLQEAFDRGIWFDGSSIEGFTRIQESDMFLVPDAATYRVLPWGSQSGKVARLLCDIFTPNGDPFEGDPRRILRRAVDLAAEQGITYNTGVELEFYLFTPENGRIRPAPHDVGGYFDFSPRDEAGLVRQDITRALEEMGMEVEMIHHEVGPGQHEIDFKYADALTSADNALTFRYTVKAIAQRHGLYATFMPKPMFGRAGSGMHTHQSLFKDGQNQFYQASDPYKLSPLAYSFMAGQLQHARALAAIVAPTVNSYKRLVPGYEAPVYVCWAQINRSALIRIPRYSPGRESSTRLELRCPDPSCNPYLAFAAMLAAGLNGVDHHLSAPAPTEEDVFHWDAERLAQAGIATLPGSLHEALTELAADEVVKGALGNHAYEAFDRAKREEWDEYRTRVTEWEVERYLEIL